MEKKVFNAPFVKMVRFDAIDVITTSGGGNDKIHPGWGPDKNDGGANDGHVIPPGQQGKGAKAVVSPISLAW